MGFPNILVVVLLSVIVGCAQAQSSSNVKARYHYYSPENLGWSLSDVDAYCAPFDAGKPLAWRKQYGWAAFCGHAGPTGKAACGKCLKVINMETGTVQTVRVIDQCRSAIGALSLDASVFRRLDTNKNGYYRGYIVAKYEFVSC